MQDHSNSKYILLELHHFTMTLKVKFVSLTNMFLHNTVVAVFYTFDFESGSESDRVRVMQYAELSRDKLSCHSLYDFKSSSRAPRILSASHLEWCILITSLAIWGEVNYLDSSHIDHFRLFDSGACSIGMSWIDWTMFPNQSEY